MRPINVSLDSVTWELAKQKPNFSQWVRDKLREERNQRQLIWKYCEVCDKSMQTTQDYCVNKSCDKFLEHKLEVIE
jgi:hypothetical protein